MIIRRSSSTPAIDDDNSRGRSSTRKQSYLRTNTPIQVDEVFVCDKFVNDDYFDETRDSRNKRSLRNIDDEYLTTEKFNYSMNLLDKKINLLYRLCRHISDK